VAPGKAHDCEIGCLGKFDGRPIAANARDRLSRAVHRIGDTRVVAGEDVAKELATDRLLTARCAEHGDAGRGEERTQ